MNQAKRTKLHVEEVEEMETDVMEELQLVPEEVVEGEMTGRSQVLETDGFPHILGMILSSLNPDSVKMAAQVSR